MTTTGPYGPQHAHVQALIERARQLTPDELDRLNTAYVSLSFRDRRALNLAVDSAIPSDASNVARATRAAIAVAPWAAIWAACDAAMALAARHSITASDYDALTLVWRTVIGRIHPDDPEVTP